MAFARFRSRKANIAGASLTALALATLGHAAQAQTLPSGADLRVGTVGVSTPAAGQMRLDQSSARAVVNWNSFDVGAGGRVTINQPDAQSALLNRVTGGVGTTIAGTITSNGAVYLVNANGVAISQGGAVDTRGGFVVSTLDITDADFMDGDSRFTFSGTAGAISNAGAITTGELGYAALLGGQIANTGFITVPKGNVVLTADSAVTIDLSGISFLQFGMSRTFADSLSIANSGSISAPGGVVTFFARDVTDAARRTINMSGLIDTSVTAGVGGSIRIQSSDTIDVSGVIHADSGEDSSSAGGGVFVQGAVINLAGATVTAKGGGDIYLNAARPGGEGGSLVLTGASLSTRGGSPGMVRIGAWRFHHGVGSDDFGQDVAFSVIPRSSALDTATVSMTSGSIDSDSILLSSSQETRLSGTTFAARLLEISSLGGVTGFDATKLNLSADGRFLLGADRIALLSSAGAVSATTDGETRVRASAFNALMGSVNIDIEATHTLRFDDTLTAGAVDPSVASDAADNNGLRLTAGGSLSLRGAIVSRGSNISLIGGDRFANGVASEAAVGLARTVDAGGMSITAGGGDLSMTADDWLLLPNVANGGAITAASSVLKLAGNLHGAIDLTGDSAILLERDTTLTGAISLHGALSGGSGVASLREFHDDDSFRYVKLAAGETIAASLSFSGAEVDSVYGSRPADGQLLTVQSGALKPGDTLNTLLAADALDYQGAIDGVGQYLYAVAPAAGFAMRAAATGYEFTYGGAPVDGAANFAARPLDPTLSGGAFAPFTQMPLITAHVIPGDDPAFTGTLDDVPVQLRRLSDTSFGLIGPIAPGEHRFTLTGAGDSRYALNTPTTASVTFTVTAAAEILPTGGTVTRGSATISQTNHAMTIAQSSDRAVIDWRSFSVGFGDTLKFEQPDAASVTLNRVGAGAAASALDGAIQSNGAVYLINPNGVAIGSGGVIDTRGGFLASTLDVDNTAFLSADDDVLRFQGSGGGVISHAGAINVAGAGAVLLAGRIVSSGDIIADGGAAVSLVAASAANLTYGYGRASAAGVVENADGPPLIDQTGGAIRVDGGGVLISAQGSGSGLSMRLAGTITADNTNRLRPGSITINNARGLLAITGALSASGLDSPTIVDRDHGGSISLFSAGDLRISGSFGATGSIGGRIDAIAYGDITIQGATLDVHGASQGGLIRIGGTYGGSRPDETAATYQAYEGRFAASPAQTPLFDDLAASVTVDASSRLIADFGVTSLDERYREGGQGSIVVRALDSVTFNAAIGRDTSFYESDGALSVVSYGALAYAPTFTADPHFGFLELGAKNLTLGDNLTPAADESVLTTAALRAIGSNALTSLSLLASDTLRLPQGFAPAAGADQRYDTIDVSLRAGRQVTIAGTVQTMRGVTAIVAGDRTIDRRAVPAGPAGIDVSQATLTAFVAAPTSQALDAAPGGFVMRLADGGAGGAILLPTMVASSALAGRSGMADFGDLAIDAGTGTIVLSGDLRIADGLKSARYAPSGGEALTDFSGKLTLTGDLALAAQATIATPTLDWTDEGGATIGGYSGASAGFAARVSIEVAGAARYRGVVGQGAAARLDLSGLDAARAASAIYGVTAADLASLTPTLLSGALQSGDTLASLLAPGSVVVSDATGDRLQIGAAPLTIAATRQFAVADGKSGYVFALGVQRAGAIAVTPRPLTFAVADAQSTYGALATLTAPTLQGVLTGDTVGGVLALSRSGVSATLGERLAAGRYTLSVGALSGASAGNYLIAASGNTAGALTIVPKSVTFTAPSLSSVYGDLASLTGGSFTGLLAGDKLAATLKLRVGASLVDPAQRTAADVYTIVADGLTGADAANYALGTSVNGQLTIAAKPITATLFSGSYTYGSPVSLVTLQGVLAGDQATPTGQLAGQPATLESIGAGYGVAGDTAVGDWALSLTGLSGASASNYALTGATSTRFNITPRSLNIALGASVNDANYAYGSPLSIVTLTGLRAGDDIAPLVSLSSGNLALGAIDGGFGFAAKTPVGSYAFELIGLTGAAAANYDLTITGRANGLALIAPRRLDWSIASASSIYGVLATPNVALVGVLAGDVVSAGVEVSQAGGAVTLGARTAAGGYQLSAGALGGADAGNYALAATGTNVGALTITPKTLDFSVASGASTYGALTLPGVSLTGLLSGDDVAAMLTASRSGATITLGDRSGVGQYDLAVTGLTGTRAANYVLGVGTRGQLTINPREIMYAVADINATYGVLAQPIANLIGRLDGDLVAPVLVVADSGGRSVTLAERTAVGAYRASVTGLTGAGAANYTLSGGDDGMIAIAPRLLGYTISGGQSVYGALFTPSATLSGVLAGDSVALGVAATINGQAVTLGERAHVGTYDLGVGGLSGASAGNYRLGAGAGGQLVITPRGLSLGGGFLSGVYGSMTDFPAMAGVLAGDEVRAAITLIDAATHSTIAYTARTAAGRYQVTLTGLSGAAAGDYQIDANGAVQFDIAPRALTLTSKDIAAQYGDLFLPTASDKLRIVTSDALSGLLAGDDVHAAFQLSGGQFSPSGRLSVGAPLIVLTAGGGLTGADRANYSLLQPDGLSRLRVAPRLLGVEWLTSGFVYGSPPNTALGRLTGVFDNESVGANLMIDASISLRLDETPGIRTFRAGAHNLVIQTLTGADSANYAAPSDIGRITVTPRAVTATIAESASVYGDTFAPTVAIDGLLAGDRVSPTVTLTNQSGAQSTLGDRSPVGVYTAKLDGLGGLDGANYSLGGSGSSATLTISPRVVRLSALGLTQTYGSAAAPTLTNALPGDDVIADLRLQDSDNLFTISARSLAGQYSIRLAGLGGSAAGNYRIDGAQNYLYWIQPRQLNLTIGDYSARYGDTLPAGMVTAASSGVLDGDDVTISASIATLGDAGARLAAGRYVISGLLSGAAAGNYVASGQGSLVITPRTLQWSLGGSGTYGDIHSSDLLIGTLNGTLAGDDVRLTGRAGGFQLGARTRVGIHTFDALNMVGALQGASAGNYALAVQPTDALASYTILPRTLTYAIADQRRVYGDPVDPFPLALLSNVVNGDDVAATRTLARLSGLSANITDTTPVGAYALTTLGLIGVDSQNYVLAGSGNRDGLLTIDRRQLTLAPTASAVYGERVDILRNVVAGEERALGFDLLWGGAVVARADAGEKRYQAQLTGLAAGNYFLSPDASTLLQITPRPITLNNSLSISAIYGDLRSITGSMSVGENISANILPGDTVRLSTSIADADRAAVTLSGGGYVPVSARYLLATGLTGNANYSFDAAGQQPLGLVSISPRDIGVVQSRSLVYGEPLAAPLALLTLTSDAVTVAYGLATADGGVKPFPDRLDAGVYAERVALQGADAANYTTTSSNLALTITPRPVYFIPSVNGSTDANLTTTYGDIKPSDVRVVARPAGWLSGLLDDLPTTYSPINSANSSFPDFVDLLGPSSTSLATSTSGMVAVGSYAGFGAVTLNANYKPIFIGRLVVLPKPVALTNVVPSLVYFGDSLNAPRYSGLVASDVVSLSNQMLGFDDVAPAYSAGGNLLPGFYAYLPPTMTGADAANYDISSLDRVRFEVGKRPVRIMAGGPSAFVNSLDMIYGDATPEALKSATLFDVVTGKPLSLIAERIHEVLPSLEFAGVWSSERLTAPSDANAGSYAARYALSGSLADYLDISTPTLLIKPKPITIDTPTFSFIYGDSPVPIDVPGVLARDAAAIKLFPQYGYDATAGQRRHSYVVLGGDLVKNYAITANNGAAANLDIGQRTLTVRKVSDGVYGDGLAGVQVLNIVYGDSFYMNWRLGSASSSLSPDGFIRLPTDTPAGARSYQLELEYQASAGGSAIFNSYKWDFEPIALTIAPKAVTWSSLSTGASHIYGDTHAPLLSITGLRAGEAVPLIFRTSSGGAASSMVTANEGATIVSLPKQAGIGTYTSFELASGNYRLTDAPFNVVMAGAAADGRAVLAGPTRNPFLDQTTYQYALADTAFKPVTITPRPLTMSLPSFEIDYGGQHKVCSGGFCVSMPGMTTPLAVTNAMPWDDVTYSGLLFTDATGALRTVGSLRPGERITASAAGLTGRGSGNYLLTPSSTPTTVTVNKATIGYQTSSGLFLRGGGFAGAVGGVTTLYGVAPGDDVSVITGFFDGPNLNSTATTLYTSVAFMPKGEHHATPIAFQYDSALYEIARPGGRYSMGGRIVVDDFDVFNTTFAGTHFGAYTPPASVLIPQSTSLTGAQANTTNSANAGPTGASASGGANAGARAGVDLGGVNLSSGVSTDVEGTAKLGLKSSLSGSATVAIELRLTDGPGFVAIGAEAAAKSSISLSLLSSSPSITVTQFARAAVSASGGAAGSIGSGLEGSFEGSVDAFALAQGSLSYGLKDGALKLGQEAFVGTGFSVGAKGGMTIPNGEISVGATVYSPGALYAGFKPSVGFDDGKLAIGLSLGAAIGIGGIKLDLDLKIDISVITNFFGDFASDVACFFSSCASDKQGDAAWDLYWTFMDKPMDTDTIDSILWRQYNVTSDGPPYDAKSASDSEKKAVQALQVKSRDTKAAKARLTSTSQWQQDLVNGFLNDPSSFGLTQYDSLIASKKQGEAALQRMNSIIGSNFALQVDSRGQASVVKK